jgi:hypothetical protein
VRWLLSWSALGDRSNARTDPAVMMAQSVFFWLLNSGF